MTTEKVCLPKAITTLDRIPYQPEDSGIHPPFGENTMTAKKPAHPPHWAKVQALDSALFELADNISILDVIAPLNYKTQKQTFFETNYKKSPTFTYKQNAIDSFQLKRKLYSLPVEKLKDEDLVNLYSDVIESYADKVEQYNSIGTSNLVYDSLRYFGEPSEKDIRNAEFILHLPASMNEKDPVPVNAKQLSKHLIAFAKEHGYEHQVKLDDKMIANALVTGLTVKINTAAQVTETEMRALAHHELGVHLVTTLNARNQPLKVLSLGCPVNTMTQEGIAILSEYLAGCMTLPRLKILALRVLAVKSMLQEKDFKRTFLMLKEEYQVSDNDAFTITARVYRGGGFTKDYLYLQGLHQMLNAYETETNFQNLLCGKVSLEHLPIISRLVGKGYLNKPKYITPAIASPSVDDPIQKFIVHAIM
ncbi:flavohemoglobin expression-modulating QEGLA motif protein [Porticoccaceae bacterium LTM1]|nr:flavohemoglobin expression-modulating QEGLA motif protein [Porticoccaceae bacterium LTM1]